MRETLELMAALDQLLGRVIVWGVEVTCTLPGEGLSPAVEEVLPGVVARLAEELEVISDQRAKRLRSAGAT